MVISCSSNVCSHAVKVAWKWYFAKEVFKEWQSSFSPDWTPEKERGWMKVIFSMKGDLAESDWVYEDSR